MNDLSKNDPIEMAFEMVLSHPGFCKYTREELRSCEIFCEMIRQSPHEDVLKFKDALEEIAYETDDHNEASGFLLMFATLGGGFEENPVVDEGINPVSNQNFSNLEEARQCYPDIPIHDVAPFADWAINISTDQRSLAYAAAMDVLVKRVVRIPDKDYDARLTHHLINTVLYYTLTDLGDLLEFGNFALENLDDGFNVREQIPKHLWEAFSSRPKQEIDRLIKKWWGSRSNIPNDFFIALEWQRKGYIKIHKGKEYHETVAEFLLDSCEPGDSEHQGRVNDGIEAIQLDPFLAEDLYEALKQKQPYQWLFSHDIPSRAIYLNELFSSGVLDRQQVLSCLDQGIAKHWDKPHLPGYKKLREQIGGQV